MIWERTDLNVSAIDPRVVKMMLLSQWTSGMNPLSTVESEAGGVQGTGDGTGLFNLLLDQLQQSSDGSDESSSTSSLFGNLPSSILSSSNSLSGTLAPDSGSSSAYDGLIQMAATQYGVDPSLIKGVIQSESSFHPNAVSQSGAKGLMQLMDDTARGLGVTNSFDPQMNIDAGTRFLSYLLRKYDGNIKSALAAYNAGPGKVDQLGLTTDAKVDAHLADLPDETQRYISKVLQAANAWGTGR